MRERIRRVVVEREGDEGDEGAGTLEKLEGRLRVYWFNRSTINLTFSFFLSFVLSKRSSAEVKCKVQSFMVFGFFLPRFS